MVQLSTTRYGSVAQFFHWSTAFLVLVAFIYGPGGSEGRVYSSANEFGRRIHETLGLCVFAIAVMRLLWRAIDRRPAAAPASRWMEVTATVVQWTLSLLLLALPLTAVAGAWLEGHPLTLVAGIDVAPIFSRSGQTGATIARIHTWLGDAIMWLAGLHALAALYHHYILGDYVLLSMLPRWIAASRTTKTDE